MGTGRRGRGLGRRGGGKYGWQKAVAGGVNCVMHTATELITVLANVRLEYQFKPILTMAFFEYGCKKTLPPPPSIPAFSCLCALYLFVLFFLCV